LHQESISRESALLVMMQKAKDAPNLLNVFIYNIKGSTQETQSLMCSLSL